jgi:RNA polymerase sigma factor (sigma-70 family)
MKVDAVEPDDLDLLTSYQRDGVESAFARLVERHNQWIFAAARRRLGDDHLADDATQAVFVVLATKAAELIASRRGSLSAWLFHVMHFTCTRLRRSQSRRSALEETAGPTLVRNDADDAAVDGPLLLLMEDCISQLSAMEREMVVRRFYQRQTFAQIGSALNVSTEAARKRVGRSLAEVRQLMLRDGVDAIPDAFLANMNRPIKTGRRAEKPATAGIRIHSNVKKEIAMIEQHTISQGGHQLISAEFLVRDVEANLDFFEKLGFPRRFTDKPDGTGKVPRASLTAGTVGKIWIRRAPEADIRPSSSINIFFWIEGGPEALIAHRRKIADRGVVVTPIIDEHALPNFNVMTPDGYSIAFFTGYVPPGQPPIVLVL